ncbi:MAG: hypothetical protein Q4B68_09940 [Bacteroidales bacterium]|nr:hypothetical protein [Bacteroidales bacterium]
MTKTVNVKGALLTGDLTLATSGEGFSVSPTTLTAAQANAGADVTVTFNGNAYGTFTGSLTITGAADGVSSVVSLTAQRANPDDDAPTVYNQLVTWTDNDGYQEVGYAGLGNYNEMLALACVNYAGGETPVINYRLFGQTAKYVRAMRFFARKRDAGHDYADKDGNAAPENTFAHIYDYRDPEKNNGAILLGFTTTVPEAGTNASFTSNRKLSAGEYVFYLAVDMKTEDEIGGIDQLPLIGGNKANYTRIGGKIQSIGCGSTTYTINTVNNYSADGGGRVILPKYQLVFVPKNKAHTNDVDYSNYYRIPAICTSANGTIVALSDARKEHIHDVSNDIDIVSRFSTDNGKTWSNYMVLFEGVRKTSTDGCEGDEGYGDASIAAFRDGTVVAAAVNGYGLNNTASKPATNIVWKVSRDNGRSWGEQKQMPYEMYGNLRGCITPGLMCVPASGVLQGKAVAALRSWYLPNPTGTQASQCRVYLVVFDPDKNEFANVLDASGNKLYVSDDYGYDEANVTQLADNTFLLSIRDSYSSDSRSFYTIAVSKNADGTFRGVPTKATSNNLSALVPANGAITTYKGKNGNYVLHCLPKDRVNRYSNKSRSSLTLYTAPKQAGNTINWTPRFSLSDPFDNVTASKQDDPEGGLSETAQYSSMTEQGDNSIAVFFEAYPYAFFHYDQKVDTDTYSAQHQGDWVMAQYYANLRIGDIVPGEEPLERQAINAPVIDPRSKTYDSNQPERPAITITQDNYVKHPDLYNTTDKKVRTYYYFSLFNSDGELVVKGDADAYFTEESKSFTWAEVLASIGYTDVDPVSGTDGWSVHAAAICRPENDANTVSLIDATTYTFNTPVRNILVVGVPTTGAANINMASDGGYVSARQWLTVGVGKEVTLSAPANYPYEFVGFYYKYQEAKYDSEGDVKLSEVLNFKETSGIRHHIVFNAPADGDFDKANNILPDNYNNEGKQGIVIYAVYDVTAGFTSRVNTQYNNGMNQVTGDFESQFSYWIPKMGSDEDVERIVNAKGGDLLDPDLVIPTFVDQENTFTDGTGTGAGHGLTYPKSLNYGLDAYVTLVPDAHTAENLNAVVRVKVGGEYRPEYYVVNGYTHPITSAMLESGNGCLGYFHWYDFVDGEICPMAVGMRSYQVGWPDKDSAKRRSSIHGDADGKAWYDVETDMAFEKIFAKGAQTNEEVHVDIYLVNNEVTHVSQLNDHSTYVAKVTHTIVQDPEVVTGVTEVTGSKTVAKVTYYNMLGVPSARPHDGVNVLVTTYTDGTTSSAKVLK